MALIDALPLLPRPIARHTLFILTGALPPPLGDLPEERAARDASAIAAVVALNPVDAGEARLAARSVAADAWAMDCLHLAGERIRLGPRHGPSLPSRGSPHDARRRQRPPLAPHHAVHPCQG